MSVGNGSRLSLRVGVRVQTELLTVILVGQAGQFQNKPGRARASQARPVERPTPAGFEQVGTAGAPWFEKPAV